MKVVIIRGINGKTSSVWIPLWAKVTLSCCLFGLPLGIGLIAGAEFFGEKKTSFFDSVASSLKGELESQQQEVNNARTDAVQKLQALSARMAKMQVQLARLEALGEVLTVKAELEDGEFDFTNPPAIGGPEFSVSSIGVEHEILSDLDTLAGRIQDRQIQLNLVSDLIQDRHLKEETSPSGLPSEKGWISSLYGRRIDPFTGASAWHNGVDIAGKMGSDVLAVAGGVVTYSDERYGYGELIEITHDNGYVTRYGHNSELLVKLGEIVKKGQVISRMGTTGRSTGPHVHFEVYKNGRAVDPSSYIRRTHR